MLINLICHNKSIILHSQFPDCHQLIFAENFSAWIGRITDNDRLRTITESLLYQVDIKLIFRRNKRDVDWICP